MIYKEFIASKNRFSVPLYSDGTPSGSKYDPVREANSFGDGTAKTTGFFVIAGIAGGFHIASLLEKFPEARIVCIEADRESLEFCIENEFIKKLDQRRLIFCTADDFIEAVVSNYIPSVYGDFSFLYLRTWADKNRNLLENIYGKIQKCLKDISADYSVQCHFGKIWQRNILLNLKLLSENNGKASFNVTTGDLQKTVAVIAAGPSLDCSINELKADRDRYFIFSTDTAYRTLLKQDVVPDAVVSIDGQSISSSHFYSCSKDTQFVFDLCASHSAVRKVISGGSNFFFVNTGHPLCLKASEFLDFAKVSSGSGTVTIAACDFALKCGFTKLKLFGSDFCYSSGKPYTKGTYLDDSYYGSSGILSPADNSFTHLMFRTETKEFVKEKYTYGSLKSPFTTEILDSYRNTLNEWLCMKGASFENDCFVFEKECGKIQLTQKNFKYKEYIDSLLESINSYTKVGDDISKIYPFLPYFAYEKSKISNNQNLNVFDFLKLEYKTILRYTYNYEAK